MIMIEAVALRRPPEILIRVIIYTAHDILIS